MRLFTAEEMRAADRHAIEKIGIPGVVLMENAGIKSLMTLEKILGGLRGKRFTIVCGRGNNGGDGLVIARHLSNNDIPVYVFVTSSPDDMTPDARTNFEILIRSGVTPVMLTEGSDIDRLRIAMEFSDCVLDCLYGTGFKGEITGFSADVIRAMNDTRAVRVGIDVPSGLCATTGRLAEVHFQAGYTITLGVAKLGLFMFPGKSAAGEVWVADIGIPAISSASAGSTHFMLTTELIRSILPDRLDTIHKGSSGKMLILASSQEYQGAGVMASYGALRSGAGMVTLGLPECLKGALSCQVLPELILRYFPCSNGGFDIASATAVELSAKYRVLMAGSGWGSGHERGESLKNLLNSWHGTAVLDADALNSIEDVDMLKKSLAKIIVTPHMGEMARLCRKNLEEVVADPIETARSFARENRVIVVLKSSVTIIAEPRGQVYVNSRPNSGLARAGTGDLLAGLVAGIASSGVSELNAALCGVHLLSEAGEMARAELGADAMTISEVASFLPRAFRKVRGDSDSGNV